MKGKIICNLYISKWSVIYFLLIILFFRCRGTNDVTLKSRYINPVTKAYFFEVDGEFYKEVCNYSMDISLCNFGSGGSGRALYLIKNNMDNDIIKMYMSGVYCFSTQLVIDTITMDTISSNSSEKYFSLYNFFYENNDTCTYKYYPRWWQNKTDSLKESFDGFCYQKHKLKLVCSKGDSISIYLPNINSTDTIGQFFTREVKVPSYSVVRVKPTPNQLRSRASN